MKILKLIFLISLTFISCNSDDSNEDSTSPLIGKWSQITESEFGIDTTTECTLLDTIEFKNDGYFVRLEYNSIGTNQILECVFREEVKLMWVVEGNKIIESIIFEGERLEYARNFKIESGVLTIDSNEGEDSFIEAYVRI